MGRLSRQWGELLKQRGSGRELTFADHVDHLDQYRTSKGLQRYGAIADMRHIRPLVGGQPKGLSRQTSAARLHNSGRRCDYSPSIIERRDFAHWVDLSERI